MGERKGQNKYYPPDYDPKVHGSLNAYHGTHYLRERARKLDRGIIIMRFEMPYNVWCLGCGRHIAMGVRYNAEKTKAGMYHSTPLFKFRMKCHLCDMHFEIQNDPKNFTYEILSGLRRKDQQFDAAENGIIELEDAETKLRRAADKMYKLEHERADAKKLEDARPQLERIEQSNARFRDDFSLNQLARGRFRTQKKAEAAAQNATNLVAKRLSLAGSGVRLLDASETDAKEAALLRLSNVRNNGIPRSDAERRSAVLKGSIFDSRHVRASGHTKKRKQAKAASREQKRSKVPFPDASAEKNDLPRGDCPSTSKCSAADSAASLISISTPEANQSGSLEQPTLQEGVKTHRTADELSQNDASPILDNKLTQNPINKIASLQMLSNYDDSDADE